MQPRNPLRTLSINVPIANRAVGSSRHSKDSDYSSDGTAMASTSSAAGSQLKKADETQHAGLMLPILPELLPQVFRWVVLACAGDLKVDERKRHLLSGAEASGHVHFTEGSSLRALLILGQVCRAWQDIVYTTPSLWSCIHLSKTESAEGDAERHHELMHFMTTKARTHPLTISISLGAHHFVYDDYYGQEHESSFMEIMWILVSQQWRLKHLHFDTHICTPMAMVTQRLANMPELKTLVFRSPVDDRAEDALIEIDLNRSPLINHLHLDGDFLLKPVDQRLDHLKVVRMLYRETFRKDFPSVEDCTMLLKSARALEVLQVDVSGEEIPTEKLNINLASLRVFSLRVNDESDEAARYLLDSLTFPNLTALELDIGRTTNTEDGPHEHVYNFLKRCKAPLSSFAFCSEETEETDVLKYLQLMPLLEDLRLTDVAFSGAGIQALTLRGNRTDNLCPKLHSLSFHDDALGDDPLEVSDDLMVMVLSRWLGATGALRRFELCGCGWRGFGKMPLVRMCIDDGLEVICE